MNKEQIINELSEVLDSFSLVDCKTSDIEIALKDKLMRLCGANSGYVIEVFCLWDRMNIFKKILYWLGLLRGDYKNHIDFTLWERLDNVDRL